MFYKKTKPQFKGLDCSGPCMVTPPSMPSAKDIVARVCGANAVDLSGVAIAYPKEGVDNTVADFLEELDSCDKVEKAQLVRDFSDYVKGLEETAKNPPADPAPDPTPDPAPDPVPDPAPSEK